MPKIKTHRGAAKRFRTTGSGKLLRNKAYKRHILTKKSPKRKRNMVGVDMVADVDQAAVRRMLPNLNL
ncbi:MAG: 50S ribosomal protein L35 [Magnetococcales bacterium]|jgi:large subunit ribosomal protein L35|uniref:50S ribosomal protein L35 n=1 Tax=Candidatus Magnetaquicoccus inordinatus TaxID=2496818 RepID=UPI00102C6F77|nr:50S ribosomal protein L35 [Candidatus Magnetaquicoccus inordinatus]MBF0097480.1 50S ribosomal protein L35 [Magnetococcales bacterium]MBF0115008.1 50S ribosomal protein L35 [Magnetococcales bacterium]